MPPKVDTRKPVVYQIKVTLNGSQPPIWRRIQVPGDTTLAELHGIVQIVMGWEDDHMHAFRVGREEYGRPGFGWDVHSERRARLNQLIPRARFKFRYEYDFGDSWEHVLEVEKKLRPEPAVHYPRCLAGERACPPEDVGGVWGYDDFLQALANPANPEHAEFLEWIGDEFDPEAFDLDAVNRVLARVKIRRLHYERIPILRMASHRPSVD